MHDLTSRIKFIGAEDDNLDLFESQYPLTEGISYNSYIIEDEKIAIVDSVDVRRCTDWLASLDEALQAAGGRRPDYLIVQHVEPDHSGSIRTILEQYPDLKVVCTAKALDMLGNYFEDVDFGKVVITVGNGDTLSLGQTTLSFYTGAMVHWPEVMLTYHDGDGVLFSADAFGSFAMSGSVEAWDSEARRYYTNIVGRFGPSVQGLLKKVSALDVKMIAPLHGPLLTGDLSRYIGLYDKWSRYEPESEGVFVAYASIYGGTAEAARRIASMLETAGVEEVSIMDLARHDVSYAVAEAFRFRHLVLCSVTYDADLFPAMHEFLYHLQRKNLANRTVAIVENGSWAPAAAKCMTAMLQSMKNMTVVEPVVTLRSRMHEADEEKLQQLVDAIVPKK